MPSRAAASCARGRLRDAMASIVAISLRCMPGMTLVVAIRATPSTPQRTGLFIVERLTAPSQAQVLKHRLR